MNVHGRLCHHRIVGRVLGVRVGNRQTDFLSGLQIDDEFEPSGASQPGSFAGLASFEEFSRSATCWSPQHHLRNLGSVE